jgi:methylenetetrahydrofolate reductase (NADPH)
MFIKDLLQRPGPCFSFEFFPPKTDEGFDALYATVAELRRLNPSFVSVTYGAGGSTRRKTVEIVAKIKQDLGIESMAHITCVGATKDEIAEVLDQVRSQGIENVLPLRGDPPEGTDGFQQTPGGFGYADELVAFIRQRYDFCLGVAGYPEGHQEATSRESDLDNLKRKVDAGADFIITQLYYDNRFFFDFVERATAAGINVPIIPGIMPVLSVGQIQRIARMCGASIPRAMAEGMERLGDDPQATRRFGIDYSTRQCEELLAHGVPGIHFYTLNRYRSTWTIFENLRKAGALSTPGA